MSDMVQTFQQPALKGAAGKSRVSQLVDEASSSPTGKCVLGAGANDGAECAEQRLEAETPQ
jgi:hypothetical protein